MVQSGLLTLSDMVVLDETPSFNPAIKAADLHAKQICKACGIQLPHYNEYATMSAYLYPHTSKAKLVAVNVLMNMFFYVDDVINDDRMEKEDLKYRKVFSKMIHIIKNGDDSFQLHPLLKVGQELHRLFFAEAEPIYLNRFISAAAKYLNTTTFALSDIVNESGRLTPERYIHYREYTSGMKMTVDLVEFAWGIDLPESIRKHPVIARMYSITSQVGCLMNDVFSYHKEVNEIGTKYNLIAVYMDEYNLDFDEGAHQAISYLNRIITEFAELETMVPQWEDQTLNAQVAHYTSGMRDIINATWHWQWTTNRYRSPESPFSELKHLL